MIISISFFQWYLTHGIVITRVYKIMQYQAHRLFLPFVEEVIRERQLASLDIALALIARTMKLLGNSFYGKFCASNSFCFF